jgi:pantothenate kinase
VLVDAALALHPCRTRAPGDDEGRAILGIAGAPGAGKTTLAEALVRVVAARCGADYVAHVPMDGFHLADVQLDRLGRRDRKGAPDTFDVDGYAAALARVRAGTDAPVYVPGFERDLEQPIAAALVVRPEARLVITEGNYLLLADERWRRVRAVVDAVWYVTGDAAVRIERLVERHIRFGKDPRAAREWVLRSDEANAALVAASERAADRIVRNTARGWSLA